MWTFLTEIQHAATSGNFDPFTSQALQNNRMGRLNSAFESQESWDTKRSFLHVTFEAKTIAHLEVTTKSPMDLGVQLPNAAYACVHFCSN